MTNVTVEPCKETWRDLPEDIREDVKDLVRQILVKTGAGWKVSVERFMKVTFDA